MTTGTEGRPQWVTLADAAAMLGKSKRTIRRWVAEGRLPNKGTPDGRMVNMAAYLTVNEQPTAATGSHEAASTWSEAAIGGHMAEVVKLRSDTAMLQSQLADVTAERDNLARDVAVLRQQVAALTDERDYLRRAHEASLVLAREAQQRALPAPHKRPWWRFWERGEEESPSAQ